MRKTFGIPGLILVLCLALAAILAGTFPANAAVLLSDDFEDGNSSGWSTSNGSWSVVTDGSRVYKQSGTSTTAHAYSGTSSWANYSVQARAKALSFNGTDRYFGICARFQSSSNYYFLSLSNGNRLDLRKKVGGALTSLASKTYAVATGTWYTLRLVVNGGSLQAYVNGTLELSASDSALAAGKAGLMTYNTSAEFDDVLVEDSGVSNTPTPTPPVTNTPTPTPAIVTPTPTPAATSTPTPTPSGATPTPTPSGATPTPTPSASGEPYPLLRPDDVPHTGPQQAQGTLPDGFASYGKGTTGGQGGTAVTVTTAAEFVDYIKRDGAYIINVQGTIDLGSVALTGFDKTYGCFAMKSNKTLQGVGSGATILNGGVTAVGVSNIIIRNLNFTTNESGGGAEDAFCAASGAHHIWIDHCTFSNFADGLVDIKRWASFVTVSYCRFFNHSKTTLVGHDDSFDDTGYLKTTYHHNWFDATTQRHPRVRYGEVHIYNNYYNDLGDYGIGAGVQARIYSEYNYFENVEDCSQFYGTGYLKDIGSFMVNCETFETNPSGVAWNPQSYYSYTADPVANVKDLCIQYAGAGKPSR